MAGNKERGSAGPSSLGRPSVQRNASGGRRAAPSVRYLVKEKLVVLVRQVVVCLDDL